MFAKIFSQIFDSSIAENYQTRHIFMDLLVLADSDGVIDMTAEAIGRRINVPIEIVRPAIEELASPDPHSRTPNEDGRRLLPLDQGRTWGWQVVNYHHYRKIRDEESRREYWRTYKKAEREGKRLRVKKGKEKKKAVPLDAKTRIAAGLEPLEGGYIPMADEIAPHKENHSQSFEQYHAKANGRTL